MKRRPASGLPRSTALMLALVASITAVPLFPGIALAYLDPEIGRASCRERV